MKFHNAAECRNMNWTLCNWHYLFNYIDIKLFHFGVTMFIKYNH